ncbi:MAG: hypothetical protein KDD41_08620, partial [Flavobacteriales bacterium]|nr:hypothetical protein [Flavobacteriales bacterium]
MINICLIYDMDNIPHEIIRQTAGNSGVVNGCKFTLYNQENIDQLPGECDALIVLNTPFTTIRTRCHANLIYLVSQEAPNDRYKWHRNSFKHFSQVYTQWPLKKKNVVPSHGFLSWYIDKSYDELQTMDLNEPRKNDVAYIGNKESILIGQVKRNEFVEELNRVFANDNNLSFDLLGRTYGAPVDNKCDKLAEYKYALAIENTIVDHYW